MSPEDMKLVESLNYIADWMARHAPSAFSPIYQQPSTPEAIARAEQAVGVAFHPQLRALLGFADGMTDRAPSLIDAFKLMSLADIVDAHAFLSNEFPDGRNVERDDGDLVEAAKGVKPAWWRPRWIPFMTNGGGDYLCADMDPARGGRAGQVVTYYHDEAFRPKRADDIARMFADFADGLKAGAYRFDADDEMFLETG
jgi:cell wall assembly regulator SMI1